MQRVAAVELALSRPEFPTVRLATARCDSPPGLGWIAGPEQRKFLASPRQAVGAAQSLAGEAGGAAEWDTITQGQ